MTRKNKTTTSASTDPSLTLAELATRYLAHLEEQGKSAGTLFSYRMELNAAQSELGAETLLARIASEDVARFNTSPRVTLLKSGKAKSQLSIDKTRRVLRMALTWAHQEGLLAAPIVDAKKDTLPSESAADAPVSAPAPQDEPVAPKAKRARKQRALEVPQPEAEAAATEAEASLAQPEPS